MAYTTINKSGDYFNTKLYTGNGSSQSFTGVGFQPDFTWIKRRGSAEGHSLFDAVRGVQKRLVTNDNGVEATISTSLTAFGSDGFTLGGNDTVNGSDNYASWNWLASNTTASNTDGSITSTVSANTTSGFSIVKWTGTGSNANIGHGLGVVPKMIISKRLSNVEDWTIYHTSLGATKKIDLNNTGAESTVSNIWNNTTPTNSLFYVGDHGRVNASGDTYIAYCFAEKKGFSKFGSYTGNGSTDGTFVYTGFKPAFVMAKSSSFISQWTIYDNKRDIDNPTIERLYPNLANATNTTATNYDFLSNGFKLRASSNDANDSGQTFIYMAFAEAPLVGSNNVPCTAR